MKSELYIEVKKRIFWLVHAAKLRSIDTMEIFLKYVNKINHKTFFMYKKGSSSKRLEFKSVIDELSIGLNDISFLDIGPAYGDSLDMCYENGAKIIDFVEIDPFFYKYNYLKAYTDGFRMNHLKRINVLQKNRYDLIWAKGAICADHLIAKKNQKKGLLLKWLDWLENISSMKGKIIICPYWTSDGKIRNIKDLNNNLFSQIMLTKGYEILPKIKNHNIDPMYPITFYKNVNKKIS